MIYLGQPYTSDDPDVLTARYFAALEWCAKLEARHPYSPIAHWHNVAIMHSLPKTADYWLEHNFHMIDISKALYALKLEGWQDSVGLAAEIQHAARKGISLFAVDPETEIITLVTPSTLLGEMKYGKDIKEPRPYLRAVDEDVGR